MLKCDTCDAVFETRAQLGGHRGAHTRRGETLKVPHYKHKYGPSNKEILCKECGKAFLSGRAVAAHMKTHRISFDELTSYHTKKARLLRELGHQCQCCQNTEWLGKPIPIQIDHIDGNSDNNERENLRLLCPNCHAQTDTYAGKNVGKVGETRRKAKMRKYGSYR